MTLHSVLLPAGAATAPSSPHRKNRKHPVIHLEQDRPQAEQMEVTARRVAQRLSDVPAPTTAISGQTLHIFDILDMKSIMDMVPNAVVPTDPQNINTYINIRGIRQVDNNADPNFGMYRNGIYDGGLRTNLGPQVDVARVEVNPGPQAGLYGRDAVGGAVNVIYATPEQKTGGYLTGSYGNYGRGELQGAINVPLSRHFALRLTGWYIDQPRGALYNATLHEYEDRYRQQGLRLGAKWTPDDNLSLTWMAEYADVHGPSLSGYAPAGVANLVQSGADETSATVYRDTPDRSHNHQLYLSQDLTYKSRWGTFQWLSSYRDYHLDAMEDGDRTDLSASSYPLTLQNQFVRHENTRNYYTELLWSSPRNRRLTFMAGASYFHEYFSFQQIYNTKIDLSLLQGIWGNIACGALRGDPTCSTIPGGGFPDTGVQAASEYAPGPGSGIGTQSWSGFVSSTFRMTPSLSLTATARYTRDRKTLSYNQYNNPMNASGRAISALFGNVYPDMALDDTAAYGNWSPSAELNYRPLRNVNLYALYSNGFRAGGFSTTTTTPSLIPYGEETATNYELGGRTQWLGGRLGVNASLFYMTQDHLLLDEADPRAPAAFSFYYLANVGSARTYGAELSAQFVLTRWWSLSGNVGWLHARLSGGRSYGSYVANQSLPDTRTWTTNIRSEMAYPLTPAYNLLFNANWHHEAGGVLDITNLPWHALDRLDLTLGMAWKQNQLVVFANNAFNNRVVDYALTDGMDILTAPATYGVRFTAAF